MRVPCAAPPPRPPATRSFLDTMEPSSLWDYRTKAHQGLLGRKGIHDGENAFCSGDDGGGRPAQRTYRAQAAFAGWAGGGPANHPPTARQPPAPVQPPANSQPPDPLVHCSLPGPGHPAWRLQARSAPPTAKC